jgi:DNA-binding transcriptional regulator GbsR (MarR family)
MPSVDPAAAAREAELLAADAIGDVIEHWGFRKVLGRIWTVLFLAAEPLPAAVIGERLQMSAGAVSMSLTELQRWGVVKRVWRPGERREFFEAETDFWKMISKVFDERERLIAESVRERLERATAVLRGAPETPATATSIDRINRLLAFVMVAQTASSDRGALISRGSGTSFGSPCARASAERARKDFAEERGASAQRRARRDGGSPILLCKHGDQWTRA